MKPVRQKTLPEAKILAKKKAAAMRGNWESSEIPRVVRPAGRVQASRHEASASQSGARRGKA